MSKFKLAIIGFGNMGKIHYKSVKKNKNCKEPIIVDTDFSLSGEYENLTLIDNFDYFLEKYTSDLDGAIISTPSSVHLYQASKLISLGIPCLVEKPLTSKIEDDNTLLQLVDKDYLLKCGLIELHNPIVEELSNIDFSKANFAHFKRHSPKTSSERKLENIVLDLALHDISIMYKIFKPKQVDVSGVNLIYDNEIAESSQVLLTLDNKLSIFISSSRQDQEKFRTLDIFSDSESYKCDLKNKIYEIKQGGKIDSISNLSITESNIQKKVDMLDRPETAEIQLEKFLNDIYVKAEDNEHLEIVKKSHELAYEIIHFN